MIANVYDSISRFAVPLFFLISGALMLSKKEPISSFYKKRLLKIFIPFLIWRLFYLYSYTGFDIQKFLALFATPNTYLDLLFSYSAGHLWFIPIILELYLLTPFLRILVDKWNSRKAFLIFLVVFLSFLAVDDLTNLFRAQRIPVLYFFPGLGFYLLGYYLHQHDYLSLLLKKTRMQVLTLTGILISLCIIAIGTYFLTARQHSFDQHLYLFYSLPNAILAILTFLLFKFHNDALSAVFNTAKRITVLKVIDRSSYGIYLIHLFILNELIALGVFKFLFPVGFKWWHVLLGLPAFMILVYVTSLGIIMIIKKLPVVKVAA